MKLWCYVLVAAVTHSGALCASEHGRVTFHNVPVPGAVVTAMQDQQRVSVVTDGEGLYVLPELAEGLWTVRVEMICFAAMEREIVVTGKSSGAVWELTMLPVTDIQLNAAVVGADSIVSASAGREAPSKGSSETGESAEVSHEKTNAGGHQIDLKALPKGVGNGDEPVTEGESDSLVVNGSVNNGAAAPLSQPAAFGNMRGGRSRYTLALGFTVGNAALDARPYSLTGQRDVKPVYNHSQGVLSLGGPIKLPRVLSARQQYGYFLLGYQWVRSSAANMQSALVPTEAERDGDLSQSRNGSGALMRFGDPITGVPFPGNIVPQSRISTQAKELLRLYPAPNIQGGTRYNYQIPVLNTTNSDSIQAHMFQYLTKGNSLNGTVTWQRTSGDVANLFGFVDASHGSNVKSTIIWSHNITPNLFTSARVEYSRSSNVSTPYFANRENISGEAGVTGNKQDPGNWGPPTLSFWSGIAALQDGQQADVHDQTAGLGGSISWIHRDHTIRAGADFRRRQVNSIGQENARGTFEFTGASTAVMINGERVNGTGSDLAGLLLGIPDTVAIAYGNADKYFRAGMYDAYITDDWQIRAGVTVNVGVRWEYESPVRELYGRLVNLDITPGFAAISPVLGNCPSGALTGINYPESLIRPDSGGIQPRVAFAWRPLATSSMVIRAGYGVYYDTAVYQRIALRMAQQSPLSKSLRVQNSSDSLRTLSDGFTASSSAMNTFAVDPHFQIGYSQNWQVTIQRDLPYSLVLLADYLGTKGTRAPQEFLPNTFPAGVANPCPSCPAGFTYFSSNGNSTRHAANVRLRRRLRAGFTASGDYTFAKAIDNAAPGVRGPDTEVVAQDWLNLRGERGLSNFDQRHLLAIQGQYTTGTGTLGGMYLGGWKGAAFQGWTVTTSISLGSGLPLTPIYSSVVQGTGVSGNIRASFTGLSLYSAPVGLHLNPSALVAPAPGQWGNAGRNSITGPSQFTLNASLSRSFHDGRFEFRIESSNALNHVTYTSWNTSITSAQFGLPTSTNAMRTVRVTLRVRL